MSICTFVIMNAGTGIDKKMHGWLYYAHKMNWFLAVTEMLACDIMNRMTKLRPRNTNRES